MKVSTDPRPAVRLEDDLPLAELISADDEPALIINGRSVCPQCGGLGCDECE